VTSVRPVELASGDAVASRSRAERSKLRRELGRLAFGRYAGSLVALIYFVETPVWVGARGWSGPWPGWPSSGSWSPTGSPG
jgi:hypothetical protein